MACKCWGASVAEVEAGVGTVRCLVAAGAPAGALHQAGGMILRRVQDGIGVDLAAADRCFKMALQAEVGVAGDEHLLVHRAVRVVTGRAAFLHGPVFKDKGTFLGGVALRAGFVLAFHCGAAAFDGIARVNLVAIHAGNLPREHWMGAG